MPSIFFIAGSRSSKLEGLRPPALSKPWNTSSAYIYFKASQTLFSTRPERYKPWVSTSGTSDSAARGPTYPSTPTQLTGLHSARRPAAGPPSPVLDRFESTPDTELPEPQRQQHTESGPSRKSGERQLSTPMRSNLSDKAPGAASLPISYPFSRKYSEV